MGKHLSYSFSFPYGEIRSIFPHKNFDCFLKIYLDSAYFLCCCPFRLRLNNSLGRNAASSTHQPYNAVGSLPQKLLCSLFIIMHFLWVIRDIRVSFPSSAASKSPKMDFQLVHTIVGYWWKFSILKYFWLNQQDFLKIVAFLTNFEKSYERYQLPVEDRVGVFTKFYYSNKKILISLITIIYSGMGVAYWIMGRGVLRSRSSATWLIPEWKVDLWWNEIKEATKQIFFLDRNIPDEVSPILNILVATGLFQR